MTEGNLEAGGQVANAQGSWGEIVADLRLLDEGWVQVIRGSTTSIFREGRNWGGRGIDHVWYNPDRGLFAIADSKTGGAILRDTREGRQLSENWTIERLEDAVGEDMAELIATEGFNRVEARIDTVTEVITYTSYVTPTQRPFGQEIPPEWRFAPLPQPPLSYYIEPSGASWTP